MPYLDIKLSNWLKVRSWSSEGMRLMMSVSDVVNILRNISLDTVSSAATFLM